MQVPIVLEILETEGERVDAARQIPEDLKS